MSYKTIDVFETRKSGELNESCSADRAASLLNIYHPFLKFEIRRKLETIHYTISLKDIYVPYTPKGKEFGYYNINDIIGWPKIYCSYPGVVIFDALNSNLLLPLFEESIVNNIRLFITDVVHESSEVEQVSLRIFDGQSINWDVFSEYCNLITKKFHDLFFRAYSNSESEEFRFVLQQRTVKENDRVKRLWQLPSGHQWESVNTMATTPYNRAGTELHASGLVYKIGAHGINRQLKYDIAQNIAWQFYNCKVSISEDFKDEYRKTRESCKGE